jgi:hypothetical protein
VRWSCPLSSGKADLGREHRQVRQIPDGLGEIAVRGSRQRGIKSRVEFIECQPALREVLTQGRG